MIMYQSGGGDYYALCDKMCVLFLQDWLSDPDAKIKPTERTKFIDGGDYVPYACSFCSMPIDPATWGTPMPVRIE